MTDLEVLTRIVWGEAEAEILSGKVGVAASIINHAAAEKKTVLQLVQEPGQFEAYQNNRFWQAPYQSSEPMIVEAKQAASRALQGQDPIGNKTHFCAYQKNPCRWHYSQTPPVQYLGNHLFVRAKIYSS
jgi:spore germination cell wall hydrolase CwlJ-like protein